MQSLSRRQFMWYFLQLLAVSQLPGCFRGEPVLGETPIPPPLVVEDHSQALARWAQVGIRDAVLINLDMHDDFRVIPEAKIAALREIYRQRDWSRFSRSDSRADDGLYHIGNWIYAGARLGIFNEIYWVIPYNFFSRSTAETELRQFLERYLFSEEDRRTFVLSDNRFRGTFHGIPIVICGLESLPDIRRPLLLSFCIDFFPAYSGSYRASYLQSLHTVFEALYRRQYRIRESVVAYSVNGNFLPPYLRWVGDAVASILENPGLLDQPPSELLLLQQELENSYRCRDANRMLALTQQYLSKYPAASLSLYQACAHHLHRDTQMALAAAVKSSKADPLYCTGLPHLGTLYYAAGELAAAEAFFKAGVAANPSMANGLFQCAHCLVKGGKLEQALAVYQMDEVLNGSFPTHFLIMETYLRLGDRQAATEALHVALKGLEQDVYAEVVNPETAHAIHTALDFCRQSGLPREGAALRGNAAVIRMVERFPRQS